MWTVRAASNAADAGSLEAIIDRGYKDVDSQLAYAMLESYGGTPYWRD